MYQKRFPANTTLETSTFLNNKKLNGELYALLQGISNFDVIDKEHNEYVTYVLKSNLPLQNDMCKSLGIKSPKTLRQHLQYLLESGYIVKGEGDIAYYLPEMEDIYFLIELETLQYLNDNCREHVIKIYIYLGQRYKMAKTQGKKYIFTLEEIGDHIGIGVKNHSRQYEVIKHALELLSNSGLVKYSDYVVGTKIKKQLDGFSFSYKKG